MSIEFSTTLGRGDRYLGKMPDASAIPVPDVATSAVEMRDAAVQFERLFRERDAAVRGIDHAKGVVATQAAMLAVKKKSLPKNIRQAVKDAQEDAEYAQVALDASAEAVRARYYELVAQLTANRAALEAAALIDAEQALQRMAAAREAFASAERAAHASYGALGMFAERDREGALTPVYRDRKGSMRAFHTTQALAEMQEAIGQNALELQAFRQGQQAPVIEDTEDEDDDVEVTSEDD